MNTPSPDRVSDRLHRLIHLAAAGLLIWFVIAAWLLFGDAGYLELALAMVSVLVLIALGVPWALWRTSVRAQRRDAAADVTVETHAEEASESSEPFDTWLRGQFATWTDRESGATAAVEALLPLAAVAFGLTALGIVLELTRAGVV